MSKTDKHSAQGLDSWDYCIAFWDGAVDDDEDARQAVREITGPRHVRAAEDAA